MTTLDPTRGQARAGRGAGPVASVPPRHHADDALLADCVSGALDPAAALVLACHAELCAACARRLADYEAVAAMLAEDAPAVPLAGDAL
ncbi:MAG: hypothetical protein HXY25_07790, partial [Alphaproteobacteria bacterium]|nr:hypothetical protein [Alphaproteobacteria bacterium]